ncbi:MAG: hypothetical protein GC160_02175 [Acidobacteria bacterium]|nr:hypothetical protein [Acidobacteriota bacterium]
MPNPFDYKFIEPLLTIAEVRGSAVFCKFTCPVTGRSVSASFPLVSPPPSHAEDPVAQRGVIGGLRRSVAAALSGVLGTSEHAEAQIEVAAADESGAAHLAPDEEARRYSITRAFRSVSSLFRWERLKLRWVAVDAEEDTLTRFESQLAVRPVRGTPDLEVLLRMLAAIARADGVFGEEERGFLAPFASAGGFTVDQIAAQPNPEFEEIETVHGSRRDSVLMICWAAAYVDGMLESHEQELLELFRRALGISVDRAAELRNRAQYHLLEKTLEDVFSDFHMTVAEEDSVIRLAQRLGLPLAETQNAIQGFRKRRGFA